MRGRPGSGASIWAAPRKKATDTENTHLFIVDLRATLKVWSTYIICQGEFNMTTKNVNAFSPRMANVLMAMPREKGTKSAPACATVTEIASSVGTRAAYTIDWLSGLGTLGLVQKVGKKGEATPESKWQLTANGRKVVGALTAGI